MTHPTGRAGSRFVFAALAGAFAVGVPRSALGMDLCDGEGHFCMVLDVTSARVCDTAHPGRSDRATCDAEDEALHVTVRRTEREIAGAGRFVAAVVVHFDEWRANVSIVRGPEVREVADDGGLDAHSTALLAAMNASARKSGWFAEENAPPGLSRVRDTQLVRTQWHWSSAGIGGVVHLVQIQYEVLADGATYYVSFATSGEDASSLGKFAGAAMATVDALPQRQANSDEASKWIARTILGGGAFVAGAFVLRARSRRRGKRAIDPRDLWPMR